MKNLKNNKTWMTVIIFAVIMTVSAALTYVMYVSGFTTRYAEFGAKIVGDWYANYAQWFWSKWYMIACGYVITAVGAGFISWSVSDLICNK